MSQGGLTASIYVDMNGNITQVINRYNQNMNQLGQNTVRQAGLMNRAVSGIQSSFGALNNNMVKFAAGGGLLMAARQVGAFESSLTRSKTNFGRTLEEMQKMKADFFNLALKHSLEAQGLLSAVNVASSITGDDAWTLSMSGKIAVAVQGIGTEYDTAGRAAASFYSKNIRAAEEVAEQFDMMFSQTKQGQLEVNDVLKVIPSVAHLPMTLAQTSAMIQAGSLTADSSGAGGAALGMLNFEKDLNNPKNAKFLEKKGINLNNKDGTRREQMDIIEDIIKSTGGNSGLLSDKTLISFSDPTVALLTQFYNQENVKKYRAMADPKNVDKGSVEAAANENAQTFDSAMTRLSESAKQFANINLAEPVLKLSKAISELDMSKFNEYSKVAGDIVKSLGAVMLAAKGYKIASSISSFGRPLGGPGGGPGGLGGTVAVTPVFVTNMPVAGMGAPVPPPHGPPAPPGPQPVPPAPTRRQRYANMTLQATSVLIAGASAAAVGYQIGTVISDVMYRWSDAQNAKDKIAYDKRVKSTQEQHPDWRQDEITDYAASNYNDPVAFKMNKDAMEAIAAKQDDPQMRTKMRARAFVLLREGKTSDQFAEEMGEKKNDEAQVEKKGVQTRYLGSNTATPSETTGSSWRGHKAASKNSDSGVSSMVDWAKGVMEEMQAQQSAVKTIQDVKPPEGTINVKITGLEKVGTNVSTTASGIVLKTNVGNTGTDLP